jgi:hypothetical protein
MSSPRRCHASGPSRTRSRRTLSRNDIPSPSLRYGPYSSRKVSSQTPPSLRLPLSSTQGLQPRGPSLSHLPTVLYPTGPTNKMASENQVFSRMKPYVSVSLDASAFSLLQAFPPFPTSEFSEFSHLHPTPVTIHNDLANRNSASAMPPAVAPFHPLPPPVAFRARLHDVILFIAQTQQFKKLVRLFL